MGNNTLSRAFGGTIVIVTLMIAVAIPLTAMAKPDKITICHAAGQDGTDHFVTLDLSSQSVYGNGGHFEENGTPRAGHQGDHLGPCADNSTTTSEDTEPTHATDGGSTSTTLPDDQTTIPGDEQEELTETTETTAPLDATTTTSGEYGAEVESTVVTTSTTGDPGTTSTSPEPELADRGSLDGSGGDGEPEVGPRDVSVGGGQVASATLPFTGVAQSLVIPGTLLLLAGAAVVFLSGGLVELSGAHLAGDSEGIRLGLHRGRHESA
jgi:hypothetical protein